VRFGYSRNYARLPRRYNSHADATIATVPNASFDSNNHTLWISAVGTTEDTSAITVTAQPHKALTRRAAFQALPKI
jgi:hypothetical protein